MHTLKRATPPLAGLLPPEQLELLARIVSKLPQVAAYNAPDHAVESLRPLSRFRPITRLLHVEDAKFMLRKGVPAQLVRKVQGNRSAIYLLYVRELCADLFRQDRERFTRGSAPTSEIYTHKCGIAWRMGQLYFAYYICRISPKQAARIVTRVFGELELEVLNPIIPITQGR